MRRPKIILKPPTGRRKHRGALAEMMACAWLLSEGYEVFRNISPHGLADLIAERDGETKRIDVKLVGDNGWISNVARLSEDQLRAGIVPLLVWPDGRCQWAETGHERTKYALENIGTGIGKPPG